MGNSVELPSPFESLAGICKFIAVSKISPAFYSTHSHPIEFACTFLRLLANSRPPIERALRDSLPLDVAAGGKLLSAAFSESIFDKKELDWFDRQMTEVLRTLVAVVRDSELPDWLTECKWAIEGAFVGN